MQAGCSEHAGGGMRRRHAVGESVACGWRHATAARGRGVGESSRGHSGQAGGRWRAACGGPRVGSGGG
eukprot:365322-Chlamydomonas_euryale.AAC.13